MINREERARALMEFDRQYKQRIYDNIPSVTRTVLCPVYLSDPFGSGAGARTSIREGGTVL